MVVALVAYRVTAPEERERLRERAIVLLRQLLAEARLQHADLAPFRAALRARTSFLVVTPLVAVLNVAIFVLMIFGAHALSDPATLVGWGANYGPRTTNGEWWRLVTSTLVHHGFLRMVIDVAALVQLGMILERLAGRWATAAVYCAAAAAAGLVNLSVYPMAVTSGPSGAMFGLYGLLFATIARTSRNPHIDDDEPDPQTVIVPRSALLWLIPASALCILSALTDDGFAFKANMLGLLAGLTGGLVMAGGITYHLPSPRRVLATAAVTLALIVARAVPMRGVTDVRPEISRIVALEGRTTDAYQTALDRFKKGAISADQLAAFIDRTIVPEFAAAGVHLKAIHGVPAEQQPLVTGAEEYLRLRSTSWHLYSEQWRSATRVPSDTRDGVVLSNANWRMQIAAQFRANAAMRGKAEGTQTASLEALQRIKPASE